MVGQIQRVSRLAALGQGKMVEISISQKCSHFVSSSVQLPVRSPRTDKCVHRCVSQDVIIPWANWFRVRVECLGIGRAECKQVQDNKLAIIPSLGPLHTAVNGGIVLSFRGRAWVEHEEADRGEAFIPLTTQKIAIGLTVAVLGHGMNAAK